MGDLLKQASQWLGAMRTTHASSPVTYQRGDTEAVVNATFARTTYEVEDEYGLRVGAEVTDFLILADELAALFDEPLSGDRIVADAKVYEVLALGGQGHWRWSDPYHVTMRIHTKEIGQA